MKILFLFQMSYIPFISTRLVNSTGNILPGPPIYFMIEEIVIMGRYEGNGDEEPVVTTHGRHVPNWLDVEP